MPFIPLALAAIGTAVGASAATATATGAIVAGTVVAGGVSAYGAYQQGQAQKNMLNYQAEASRVQAQNVKNASDANITATMDQAGRNSTILNRQQAAIRGAQAAAAGGQGTAGSVTSSDIAKDTFTKQEMDQQTLMYNANVKAWDITNKANNQLWSLGAQEGQDEMGAKNAEFAGDIGAATSLLNTASQVGTEKYLLSR